MGSCLSSLCGGEILPGIPGRTKEDCDELKDSELPLGIILTGGAKLREEGFLGMGVKVAVIDDGIDRDHPGFGGKVTRKEWYRTGPMGDHGTHVAGTIHLMAPEADLYDYRVFGAQGKPIVTSIAAAIRDAADSGCKLINMSLGGPQPSAAILRAVQYAYAKGVILVCAAGNEGDNSPLTNEISYPASYDECLSIAAVSKKDGFPVAFFSNSNAQVDYAGIGVDVVSFKPGGGCQKMSGTSMACPHVCGLLACLLQKHGLETSDNELRLILNREYAIDIGKEGVDNETGVGFLSYLDESAFDAILPRQKVLATTE